jgi:hypothetical protein
MLTISKTESTAVPTLFKPGYNQINSSVQHLFRGAFLFARKTYQYNRSYLLLAAIAFLDFGSREWKSEPADVGQMGKYRLW